MIPRLADPGSSRWPASDRAQANPAWLPRRKRPVRRRARGWRGRAVACLAVLLAAGVIIEQALDMVLDDELAAVMLALILAVVMIAAVGPLIGKPRLGLRR